jgi:integrative and conjugative element protein (TIGR02256 family)
MRKSSGLVWLPKETNGFMIAEANRRSPQETGGSLLGYWSSQWNEVVITHATGPGPGAIHELFSFVPDDVYQEEAIAIHYEESGRLHTYLGDWHTHPDQNDIALSRTDRLTLRKIANYPAARMDRPIMLVLGGSDWKLKIWRYEPTFLSRVRIRIKAVPMELRIYS